MERAAAALVGVAFFGTFVVRVLWDCIMPTDFSRDGIGWRPKEAAKGIGSLSDAVDAVQRRLERVEDESREARKIPLEQLEDSGDSVVDALAAAPRSLGRSIGQWLGVRSKP
jgi:hypothetical protein